MRLILAALAFWASLAAAQAEETFGGTAFDQWNILQWSSGPLPIPKGWTFVQDKTQIFGQTTHIFRGLPPGATWQAGWIDTGVFVWRFHYGPPEKSTRDTLHLSILKATAAGSEDFELLAWEELDGVRATLHRAVGPEGQVDRGVFLSFWGPGRTVNVMSAFAPEGEFDSSGALAYAGTLFETLTGQKGLKQKVAALKPREKLPAQEKPYTMSKETKPVEWQGRTIHVPADWQVSFTPIDQGLAEGLSMGIKASPNLADKDAPNMQYARFSGEKGDALGFLKQLLELGKQKDETQKTERLSKIGDVACALGTGAGEAVAELRGFACVAIGDIEGTNIVEIFAFETPADEYEALGGSKVPLLMTQEIEPDKLDDRLTIALDPAKKLLTTRETPPFPALTPVGQYRVPAGWETELSFLDGELRFFGPGESGERPMLAYRARTDTGTDAEVALTNLIEDYGISDFTLDHSDYLDGANGLIAVGTGMREGKPVKFAGIAEKDDPSIHVFMAPPEQFDAMGGASLLAPVFLKFPPDSFEGIAEPAERIKLIAKREGERIVKEREEMRQLKIWQEKMEAQSIMNAFHSMSMAIACGGWC